MPETNPSHSLPESLRFPAGFLPGQIRPKRREPKGLREWVSLAPMSRVPSRPSSSGLLLFVVFLKKNIKKKRKQTKPQRTQGKNTRLTRGVGGPILTVTAHALPNQALTDLNRQEFPEGFR